MGSSYTLFKPLDLSKSKGKKKKTLINANIHTSISLHGKWQMSLGL